MTAESLQICSQPGTWLSQSLGGKRGGYAHLAQPGKKVSAALHQSLHLQPALPFLCFQASSFIFGEPLPSFAFSPQQ